MPTKAAVTFRTGTDDAALADTQARGADANTGAMRANGAADTVDAAGLPALVASTTAARDAALVAAGFFNPLAAEQDASGNPADVDLLAVARLALQWVQFRPDVDGGQMAFERMTLNANTASVRFEGFSDMAGTNVVFATDLNTDPLPVFQRAADNTTSAYSWCRFNYQLIQTLAAYNNRTIAAVNIPGIYLNGLHTNYGAATEAVRTLRETEPYDRAALKSLVERGVPDVVPGSLVLNGAGDPQTQTLRFPDGYNALSPSTFDPDGRLETIRIRYPRKVAAETTGTDIVIAYSYPASGGRVENIFAVDQGAATLS